MEDGSLQINIGNLRTIIGEMKLSFVVESSGQSHLDIYCSDPTDGRKSGVFFRLDGRKYQELKDLIAKTDATVAKLEAAGQVTPGTLIRRGL